MRLLLLSLIFTGLSTWALPEPTSEAPASDPDKALLMKMEKAEAKGQEFHLTEDDNAKLLLKVRNAVAAINLLTLKELGAKADEVEAAIEKDGVTEDITFRAMVISKVLVANQVNYNLHSPLDPDDQAAMDKLSRLDSTVKEKLKSTTD